MPLSFPSSPTVGQTYTVGTRTWTWDGTIWSMQAATLGVASISTAEIADGAVTTEKIASGAVVEADIASNAVTAGKLGTDVQLGYRNVVINGAMQVHQRGTSVASITTTGYRTADRWMFENITTGTWTVSVENDAPTGSGFRKSFKALCTTAKSSLSAGDNLNLQTRIEGQNLQQFAKGTPSARPFSVSFWVKSNATGTYIVELYDGDNTRQVSASYTVSASGVWERKTITFPADTTGAFDNDNQLSLYFVFHLSSGTNLTSGTLNTVWASVTNANRLVGQTNLAAATNNYWQVTGVQLEAGSVATPFEFEDIGTTLAKCQRYYQTSYQTGVTPGSSTIVSNALHAGWAASASGAIAGITYTTPVKMRAEPTQTLYDLAGNSARYTGVAADGTQTNNQAFNSVGSHQSGGYGRLYGVAYSGMIFQWVHSAEL